MQFDDLKFYAQIAGDVLMACTFGVSIFTLIHTSSKKRIEDIRKAIGDGDSSLKKELDVCQELNTKRLTMHSSRLDDHGLRLTRLEERVNGMPTHRDLEKISSGMAEVREDVAANTERTNATFDMVRSIQNFLMGNRS
jgi:hypothetical protein